MGCTVNFAQSPSGDFVAEPPIKGVKLWKFRPSGLTDLVHPASDWISNNEDEMAEWWFSRVGNTDINAIQVMHHNGQLTTIYRDEH